MTATNYDNIKPFGFGGVKSSLASFGGGTGAFLAGFFPAGDLTSDAMLPVATAPSCGKTKYRY